MKIFHFFRRLVVGDKAINNRASMLRGVVVCAFIALVALFFTQPAGEPASVFEQPIPLPAELGLEPGPPFY